MLRMSRKLSASPPLARFTLHRVEFGRLPTRGIAGQTGLRSNLKNLGAVSLDQGSKAEGSRHRTSIHSAKRWLPK